jgi:hypothetical protein
VDVVNSSKNWLKSTCRGWHRAWTELRMRHNYDLYVCPDSGEVWQYMGTLDNMHEFRHRSLYGVRVLDRIPVMENDFEVCDRSCEIGVPTCENPLTFDLNIRC